LLMVVVVESNNPGCIRIRGKEYVTLLVRVLLSVKVAEGQLLVHVGLALSQFWLSEEEWGDREREREGERGQPAFKSKGKQRVDGGIGGAVRTFISELWKWKNPSFFMYFR
jgi:membrane glycosyltransferase